MEARERAERERKKPSPEKLNETGLFTYEDDGFTIKLKDTDKKYYGWMWINWWLIKSTCLL